MQKPTRRHSTDELVFSRFQTVTEVDEFGNKVKSKREVEYKEPRYERYAPVTNKGKTYPFGSKRQGF